jgi:hypothetical protein
MQFNRHSGVHLVCIQMSAQIIAIANEPPSAILLILLTRGVNCCCNKATSGVWGHHCFQRLSCNTLSLLLLRVPNGLQNFLEVPGLSIRVFGHKIKKHT